MRLLAKDLQHDLLRNVHIDNLDLIIEAISSPSSGEERDYNRLEFLGDSSLKFCATMQLMAQHLNWPEVRCSREAALIETKILFYARIVRHKLTCIKTGISH